MQLKFMILMKLILFILIWAFSVNATPRIDPMVDTKVGVIRGLHASDGDYSMFLGIPYAKVDERNPFGPSTPSPKFVDIFEAIDDSAVCPQLKNTDNTIDGSLDCLVLNIYVPNSATSNNPVPVLVWFYGGSFYQGFAGRSLYGPKFLVRHNVILVTVNYRVGPYGFMCLGTPEIPGNQGLKDQLSALRWIHNNIKAFGGDVNKITLFGESAGGRSVDFHLVSDQEKLFDKVIMQSGNSICPPVIGEVDTQPPFLIAEKIGLKTSNISEALQFLAKVDPKTIIAASLAIDYTFRPCVENDLKDVEKFVSDYTINKNITKVQSTPIMVGYNNNEKIMPYINMNQTSLKNVNVFENLLINYFDFDEQRLQEMVQLVKQFYIGDEDINEDMIQSVANFDSDFTYLHPTHRRTYQNILNGAQMSNIYHYLFSYGGKRNLSFKNHNVSVGAAHADELAYLFDIQYHLMEDPTDEDQIIIDRMTTLWTNFAKFGKFKNIFMKIDGNNPYAICILSNKNRFINDWDSSNPTPDVSDLLPVIWKPITENIMYYYEIDSEIRLKKRPFQSRMTFWDLFFKYNRQFQKGYK